MKCTYILLCKMLYGWSDMWKQQNLLSSARINHCLYMFEVLPQYFVQWWMFNYQADVTVSCFSTKIILKGYKCLYYSFWYFFFKLLKSCCEDCQLIWALNHLSYSLFSMYVCIPFSQLYTNKRMKFSEIIPMKPEGYLWKCTPTIKISGKLRQFRDNQLSTSEYWKNKYI